MTEQNFDQMRRAMVASQLRTTGVNDPAVIAAMSEVARERFVPAERRAIAYADTVVPLGEGRALNPPMTLGRLLTEAHLKGSERALVIGAGTGYSAAVLARLVESVTALEESADLAARARDALAGSGVTVVEGPLNQGHAAGAPYDFVLIDGAVEYIPDAIVDQLANGGRLGTALIDRGITRLVVGRKAGGAFGYLSLSDAGVPALPGFACPGAFTF